MTNSRAKGKRGELQLAHLLTSLGHPARRGQQHAGGGDSPDVVCDSLPIHWEVKLYGSCQIMSPAMITSWTDQAIRDAAPGRLPVIAHRWSRSGWWVCPIRPGRAPCWLRLEAFVAEVEAGLWGAA